jgi:hypothetical protein
MDGWNARASLRTRPVVSGLPLRGAENGPARRVLTMAAGGWGDPGDSPNRFGRRDAPDAGGESAPPPDGTAPDRF